MFLNEGFADMRKEAILSLQAACAAQLSTPQTHGTAMGIVIGFAAFA